MEDVICIIIKNLVNVAMRSDAWFYNIFMYLHNKNILEYAQIAQSGLKLCFQILKFTLMNYNSFNHSYSKVARG